MEKHEERTVRVSTDTTFDTMASGVRGVNDLSRWKAVLEARGFFIFDDVDTDHEPPYGYIAVYGSGEDWESDKPPQYGCLCDKDDDDSSAEFRERIAKKVFGDRAWFQPAHGLGRDPEWCLFPSAFETPGFSISNGAVGIAPTKLAALLSALEGKANA